MALPGSSRVGGGVFVDADRARYFYTACRQQLNIDEPNTKKCMNAMAPGRRVYCLPSWNENTPMIYFLDPIGTRNGRRLGRRRRCAAPWRRVPPESRLMQVPLASTHAWGLTVRGAHVPMVSPRHKQIWRIPACISKPTGFPCQNMV